MVFRKLVSPSEFFNILPQDWRDDLLPQWQDLEGTSDVFVVKYRADVISGGIVFHQMLPQLSAVEFQASMLFKNVPYIGYIYTQPEYRSLGAASFWFHALFNRRKNQSYWLSIEDLRLSFFYQKFGFSLYEFKEQSIDEYIMIKTK